MRTVSMTHAAADGTVPIEVLWVGAIAVVLAAVITAVGVHLQTRRTLQAQREGLEQQLSHERALREREELRVLVDGAAGLIDSLAFEVMVAITDLKVAFDEAEEEADGDIDDLPEDHPFAQVYKEKIDEVFARLREANAFRTRLLLRLGFRNAAVAHYQEAIDVLNQIHNRLIGTEFLEFEAQGEEFLVVGQHVKDFLAEAHGLIGTDLVATG